MMGTSQIGRGSAVSGDYDRELLPAGSQYDDGHDDEEDDSLVRFPWCCGGVARDYKKRCPQYLSDIRDAFDRKTLSSALFMFWATFLSTVALGKELLARPAHVRPLCA